MRPPRQQGVRLLPGLRGALHGSVPSFTAAPRAGKPVELRTERFILRSATLADASERWISWSADSEVMKPLNVPAKPLTMTELRAYISSFDNLSRHLVGVFEHKSKVQIGFFMIEVLERQALATFNLAIGDKSWWGKGVVNEARAALLDHFFEKRGIEKAYGTPNARNFPAILNYKVQGWRLEGIAREHIKCVYGGGRLDQICFGLLKREWLARRNRGTE
jgi:[ribosomal protein S5]-alanine N-acetyltransferase